VRSHLHRSDRSSPHGGTRELPRRALAWWPWLESARYSVELSGRAPPAAATRVRMKFRVMSVLPVLLVSVGCRDDGANSPVDAGEERDGALSEVTLDAGRVPSNDAAPATHWDQTVANDELTLGLETSVDELTIVELGSTAGDEPSSPSAHDVDASVFESTWAAASSSASVVSTDAPPLETDVLTLAFDTETAAASTTTDVDSDATIGSTSVDDAGTTSSHGLT